MNVCTCVCEREFVVQKKAPTVVVNPIALDNLLFAFYVLYYTETIECVAVTGSSARTTSAAAQRIGPAAAAAATARLAVFDIEILQLLQTEPLAVDGDAKVAQIDRVLGGGIADAAPAGHHATVSGCPQLPTR